MSWPILDRPALAERVQRRLDARPFGAALLSGPSGTGKTTVARHVADGWTARGGTVLSVVGMAELGEVPLAPFVPLADALGLDPGGLTAPAVIAAVGARPGALLVADDAPLLDPTSAAVVYQLLRSFGTRAVLTARTGHVAAGPVERLLHEQVAEEIAVRGLDVEEVRVLLRRHFDAAPRPDDVARLHRQTDGNPLLLRELVARTEGWGRVRRVAAGVELDPVEVPADVRQSMAARLDDLTGEEQSLVAAIALGGGAPDAVLLGAAERRSVALLVDAGVLARGTDGVVRPVHPVVGEAALGRLARAERERLTSVVADRLEAAGEPSLRFAGILLRHEAGVAAGAADLAWAVGHAYGRGEYLVVAQLCADADPAALGVRTLVQWASALSWLDRLDDADATFAEAARRTAGSTDRALLVSRWGAHLAYRRFDVVAALALAERHLPLLDDADRTALAPEVRTWRTLAGQVRAAGGPEARPDGAGPEVAVRAAIASVMIDAMGGRTGDEVAGVLTALEQEHGVLEPHAADMVHLQRYFALLSQGRGVDAQDVVEQRRAVCPPDAAGIWTYTLGIHLMYGGRLAHAAGLADLAVEQLAWRDPIGLLGAARVLQALVAVLQGDPARAQALLDDIPEEQRTDPKAAMLLAETGALLLAAAGRRDDAAALLVSAAGQAHAVGFTLVGAISLGICLRLGVVEEAGELLAAMRESVRAPGADELGLYVALHETAAGLAGRDPARVLAGAEALGAAGMGVAAIDALLLAEPMAPAAGAGELRRRLHEARRRWAASSEAVPLQAAERDGVTEREWEVARLVCARRTSREIAGELGISVRTVDNHLANVYRKLGVSGRAGLRAALGEDDGSAEPVAAPAGV